MPVALQVRGRPISIMKLLFTIVNPDFDHSLHMSYVEADIYLAITTTIWIDNNSNGNVSETHTNYLKK